jgi:enoyl-CoA hydratase
VALIELHRADAVAVLTLNRPEAMNAFDDALLVELAAALDELEADEALRAVVVTGAGRAFGTGAALDQMAARDAAANAAYNLRVVAAIERLAALPVPTIAAVGGYALGGGLELALACSIRVAARDAQLGLPEVRLGILPGAGGTQRLPRLIGTGAALRLLLTGARIDGDEALRLGVVDAVCPPGEALESALVIAREIAAAAPLAVRAVLASVREGADLPLDAALARTREHLEGLLATADAAEGFRAFLDRRPAGFSGR